MTEVPDRSGGQTGEWGGITLNTAVQYALELLGDGYRIVGSEMTTFISEDCWCIVAESDGDGTERVLYVNSKGVIGEAV